MDPNESKDWVRAVTIISRVLALVVVWAAVAGLSYLVNSMGHFDGGGAVWLVITGFILTVGILKIDT